MSIAHHNSIAPDHLTSNFRSAKLSVHENGNDAPIDVVQILSFNKTKGKLLVTPIEGPRTEKVFQYIDGVWHLMFTDPLHDNPVYNTRFIYDLRLSANQ